MRPRRRRIAAVGLTVVLTIGGIGLGLLAVGVATAWGWRFVAPGAIAVTLSIPLAYRIERRRIAAAARLRRPPRSRWL